MTSKPIQEQFGDRVIALFADFARADLLSIDELAKTQFSHIADRDLRATLCQVYYGARWVYKLGLALLVKDHERAAHIRAQIVDYASIVEALLSYFIGHAIRRGHVIGESYQWQDPHRKTKAVHWSHRDIDRLLGRQSLWWLITVAEEFRIIGPTLAQDLQWLRVQRNSVHLRERAAVGSAAYLNQSRKAFDLVNSTISATAAWRTTHL